MMSIQYKLFELGPALTVIFEVAIEPKEEDFEEFSETLYEAYYEQNPHEAREKLYNFTSLSVLLKQEIYLCNLREKENLKAAADYIRTYYTKHLHEDGVQISFEEQLRLVAKCLPPVFSRGTQFSRE